MRAFLLGLTVSALACTDPVSSERALRVTIAEPLFEQEADTPAEVRFIVANESQHAVFLARCGDRLMVAIDRQESRRWVPYSSDMCQAIHLSDPVEILPGEARTGVRSIVATGRYRIRIGTQRDRNGATSWDVTSNAFEVR